MGSAPNYLRSLLVAVAAFAPSAVLFYYGTGEHPTWWFPWCAALILLLAAPRLPRSAAFVVSASAFFCGSLNMLRYTRNILALPNAWAAHAVGPAPFAICAFMALPACIFGLGVDLFRFYVSRGKLWRGALIFPLVWTVYEYLASVISPHGTFGSIAYTQMEDLPLLQFASITGMFGVSFCTFLGPSILATLTVKTGHSGQKLALAGVGGIFLAVVFAFGFWRLHAGPEAGPNIEIGMVASDLPGNLDISDPGKDTERKQRDYVDHARPLTMQGARIIIFPEKLGVTVPLTAEADDAILQSFANRSGAELMVGIVRSSPPRLLNEARIYEPARANPIIYDKHHMLPQFESQLSPGVGLTLLRGSHGIWGVEVCKDMDFQNLARRYGKAGVDLMLVSAWDFDDDNWLHARMAVMRGVENGFTIARSAKEGLLTISDDRGRILSQEGSKAAPFATLLTSAPIGHEATLYDAFGDYFAWVCLIALLGIVGSLILSGQKE
jgi:apolipoprotein N-acyltransferase